MAPSYGPNLGKLINALTGDSFDTDFRAFLRMVDAIVQCAVISKTLSAPPGSPANGDRYIVGPAPTGAWAGNANAIAVWTTDDPGFVSGAWQFYPPKFGWIVPNLVDTTVYVYNGVAWAAIGGGSSTLAGDTDVVLTSPTDGQVLTYNAASSKWKNATGGGGGGSSTLAGDTDVLIASPANGQVLTYNSSASKWQNTTPSGGGTLAGDTDVALASPANGQVLTYDSTSSKWKNAAPGGGGGAPASGTPLVPGPIFANSDTSFTGYSSITRIPGNALSYLSSSFKVQLMFCAGTGCHIAGATILRTAANKTAVLDSAPIKFGGSNTLTQAFGFTASVTSPFIATSDAITAYTLDRTHDYYIVVYFDSDGTYNSTVGLGCGPTTTNYPGTGLLYAGYTAGDQTGATTIAISNGYLGHLLWGVVQS